MIIFDAARDACGHDHGACLAANFSSCEHLLVEMLDHHGGLLRDGVGISLDEGAKLAPRTLSVEHRVVLDRLHDAVERVDGGVVLENVEDEAFLDRLLHGVDVERLPLLRAVVTCHGLARTVEHLLAEHFERLVLRRRREGEIAGVLEELSAFHQGVDLVLRILCVHGGA